MARDPGRRPWAAPLRGEASSGKSGNLPAFPIRFDLRLVVWRIMAGSGGEEQGTVSDAPVVLMVLAPSRAQELGAALERRGAKVVVSSMLRAAAEAARVKPKAVLVDEAVDVEGLRAELADEPVTRDLDVMVLGASERDIDASAVAERVLPADALEPQPKREPAPELAPLSLRAPPKPLSLRAPAKPLSLRAPPKPVPTAEARSESERAPLSLRAPPKPFELVRPSRPPPLPTPLPAATPSPAAAARRKRVATPTVQPSESPRPVVTRARETTSSRTVWLLPVAALVAILAFAWVNRSPPGGNEEAVAPPAPRNVPRSALEPVPAPEPAAATATATASAPRVPPALPQAKAEGCDALNQSLPPAQGVYPGAALSKVALARDAMFRRSTKEAHQILCHALHLDPKSTAASAALASLLVDMGDAEQALRYAEAALAAPSPPSDARLAAADALALAGQFERARRELLQGAADATVPAELAKADDALDPVQARRHALRAFALDPVSGPAARAVSKSLEASSEVSAAKAWADYAGGGAP